MEGIVPHGSTSATTVFCHLEYVPGRMTFKLIPKQNPRDSETQMH